MSNIVGLFISYWKLAPIRVITLHKYTCPLLVVASETLTEGKIYRGHDVCGSQISKNRKRDILKHMKERTDFANVD